MFCVSSSLISIIDVITQIVLVKDNTADAWKLQDCGGENVQRALEG